MNKPLFILGLSLLLIGLSSCGPEPTVAPQEVFETPEELGLPTNPPPPTATQPVTPVPTEAARLFSPYRHPTGVFSILLPPDWEAIDRSNDQQLSVRFLPPIGFSSRITIDVTNEGPLPPQEVRAEIESYIRLHYVEKPGYVEVNRSDFVDGRQQIVFLYDDTMGGTGRETLYITQAGPYLSMMRAFLAEHDTYTLSNTQEAIVGSFAIDSQVVWGSAVSAINPAELLFINTLIWDARGDVTYYMGDILNASPSDISNVTIRVVFCTPDGIVLEEVEQAPALNIIKKGGAIPFSIKLEDMPDTIQICTQEISAQPAQPDPGYTTSLSIDSSAGEDDKRNLVISGQIFNPTLSTVTNIEIIAAIYNEESIVAYGTINLGIDVRLEPGQALEFAIPFPETGGDGERYIILSQAQVIRETNPSLIPTATP